MTPLTKKTRFRLLFFSALLIFSILAGMIMIYFQTGTIFVPQLPFTISTIFFLVLFMGILTIRLLKHFDGMPQKKMIRRIPLAMAVFIVSSYLIANIVITLGTLVWFLIHHLDLTNFFQHLFRNELPFANIRMLFWLMFFSVTFFFVLWRKTALREQALREETLKSQYDNLKAGINPHFLFNSLNTLSELVYDDAAKAEHYIQGLATIYRYVIEHEDSELVTLDEELDFVDRYFNLQKIRENGKLILEKTVSETGRYLVIPVSVQTLVENAIKHNAASSASPLKIEIVTENDRLLVRNNLQRKNRLEPTTGKGLKNLQRRLRLMTGKEMEISEHGGNFEVSIPMIKMTNEDIDH